MKKKFFFGMFMFFVLVTGYKGMLVASEFNAKTQKANQNKSDLEKKRKELQSKVNEIENDKKDIMKYIASLDRQTEELLEEEAVLGNKIKKEKKKLKKIKNLWEELKETESSQYDTMKKRIKYMYEKGSSDYLDIILSSDNMSDFLNRTEYIEKISSYDRILLQKYQDTKREAEKQKQRVNDKLEELSTLKEELRLQKSTIYTMTENKTKELNQYVEKAEESKGQIEIFDEEIAKQEKIIGDLLLKEQRRIQEEIRRQEEERKKIEEEKRKQQEKQEQEKQEQEKREQENSNRKDNRTPEPAAETSVYTSGFRWPLNIKGTITSQFGSRNSPTAGASSYHQGIDIGVPSGTPIVAAQSGTVVTASYQSAAGNYVMIHHGNSTFTVYMHCLKLAVEQGQTVSKGQVIAYVGSTGVSTGPHLHFGISNNGAYVNPLSYVSQ